ncbi:MAG TPA: hypothetical protein VGK65_06565 [Candidatus Binatia bacterium]
MLPTTEAEVDAFMRGGLYNRVTYEDARENCPVLWTEMNAIEEELRQFPQTRSRGTDARNINSSPPVAPGCAAD